jgi:gliding motility-associated lipoprotein GldB
MRKLTIISLVSLTILFAYITYRYFASNYFKKPLIANIQIELPISRLEKELFKLSTQEEIRDFLQANLLFKQRFLGASHPNQEEAVINQLHQLVHNPGMQELYQEVVQAFGDSGSIEQQLKKAFSHFHAYYPDVPFPQIMTFITGMSTDLYVDKDLIVIGLDFFLGENARFRPLHTPHYILRTYQADYIVPKVLLLFSQLFQKNSPTDQTLLHDMLAYGKSYYFTKALLPDMSDHIILGYTPEQLADTKQNQHIIWAHFIENQLLYETNHLIKKRYLGNRPFTAEIGTKCPGNIGGWLGWEIIKQYMQRHPQTRLPVLMEQTDAQQLLMDSKYRPHK